VLQVALAAPVYSQLHYFAQLCAAELLAPWMHPAILQKQLKLLLILITVVLWVLFPEMNLGLIDENKCR
jgi:hypothetical protein